MDRQVINLLENESWVLDGSQETNRALDEILAYQLTRLNYPERAAATIKMMEAMQRASWYQDGVDTSEKVVIAETFSLLLKTQKGYGNPATGQPRLTFLQNYDWPALLSLALENRSFATHITSTGREIAILAAGTPGLESRGIDALRIAERYLPDVEKLVGELQAGSVLVVVEPETTANERDVCGFAVEEISLTHVEADCGSLETTVVHELVHLSTPQVFSTWFEEGTAYWAAALIRPATAASAFLLSGFATATFPSDRGPTSIEDYDRHSQAGFAFYLELAGIIGPSAVSEHIKGIAAKSSGPRVIESAWKVTPAEKQAEVRALFERRCQGCTLPH